MAPPTLFEKDEAERVALQMDLDLLEDALARHIIAALPQTEAETFLRRAVDLQRELRENMKNMCIHAARGTDLSAQSLEYRQMNTAAGRHHSALHGIVMAFPVTQPPAAAAVGPATTSNRPRLPPLELPKFNGNLQEWVSFRDLFTTAIHSSSISNVEKLTHLKSLLTGEAARQIRSMVLTEDNYDIAWKALHERYENKRELLIQIIRRLLTQPSVVSASAMSLRSLVDTTKECVRSLEVLAIATEHWDPMLFYILFTKMDNTSRELWEQGLPDTAIPKLSSIYEFLEQRSRALAASNAPQPRQQVRQPQQNHVRAHHAETSKCPLGCSRTHLLFQCPEFQKLTIQQRQGEIKRLKRCLNCLGEGHRANDCKSKFSCKTCKQKHHSMLHYATNADQISNAATAQSMHLYSNDSIRTGLLATAAVKVHAPMGGNMRRTLLDNGSTNSFITERAARTMKLRLRPVHIPVSGLQAAPCGNVKHVTTFRISPHFESSFTAEVTALVVSTISSSIPSETLTKDKWCHLEGLTLADPEFHIPEPVDILLGTEHFWTILGSEKVRGEDGQPIAVKSELGWLVAGPNNSSSPVSVFNTNVDLNYQLSRFIEQETILDEDKLSKEEKDCEDHFAKHHTRDESGRFTVALPLKTDQINLGDSRNQAFRRFLNLEKKFLINQKNKPNSTKLASQWKDYVSFMDEYESMGHMSLVPANEVADPDNPVYYIPHHCVVKESSTTTKLRVVFDASASSTNGLSLNDLLMVGPPLQDHIPEIMIRFRIPQIVFTADIAKMYRQIRVTPKDADLQRILWRKHPDDPIQEYRLDTVTYGTASAPYQAVKCLQQLAVDEQHRFAKGSKVALEDFYVDDTASGCSTLEQAKEVVQQLQDLCKSGGFELRKWTTNSQELLDTIPLELRETSSLVEIQHHDPTIKTLGIYWNPSSDNYLFKITMPPDLQGNETKRTILSSIARIYDPLGWLAPVIIVCKMFMQDLWKLQIGWDDKLPQEVLNKWITVKESLADLSRLEIPRCVVSNSSIRLILVGCCDASLKAISACVYIVSVPNSNSGPATEPTINLLTSKTNVASLKHVTLPRMELNGAVLLSELLKSTLKALKIPIAEIRAFTDSTITLHWVTSPPTKWKPYIRRRVQAVQENAPNVTWYHIPGEINPADCASRGITSTDLLHHPLWWNGTPYFMSPQFSTHELLEDELSKLELETKPKVFVANAVPLHPLFLKYSSFRKLQRVMAYILRFANNWLRPLRNTPIYLGPLTVSELDSASNFIYRQLQHSTFSSEISLLQEKKPLPKGNSIVNLNPFLCKKGLLRVGGRLENAKIPYNQKHQILLPKSHHLTNSIIWDIHFRHLHSGPSATQAKFQQRFWVYNIRETIRFQIRKCVTCTRHRAVMMKQIMGDLPYDRVNPSRPFSKVGVDYAGPFNLKPMVRSRAVLKCWIAVFVCFATRAIHIEIVDTLSTDGFLAALRRFTSRRGVPSDIYSDCGTNFKGADKVLREFFVISRKADVQSSISAEGIRWHFNPAGAPHFGGLWEAGVKSIKYHLYRVLGPGKPTSAEMNTLLIQIEGILNSRPLIPASADPSDLGVLTPAHFLIGAPITALPEPCLLDLKENHLSRWQRLQQQQQLFWKRWSSEFITRLQQRPKWWTPSPELAVGHMVIIKDERLPPLKWKLGRVIATHPGKDQHVRVATVKTADGEIKRPIAKLSLLPISV